VIIIIIILFLFWETENFFVSIIIYFKNTKNSPENLCKQILKFWLKLQKSTIFLSCKSIPQYFLLCLES